jgi:glutamate formiminotransferase/formiminotetrahydrofolate cyclodeaminase
MEKIVECVPNVSEGKDRAVLDELSRVVQSVAGVRLLDVDPGAETNRTVFTFVGAPGPIAEAAFLFIRRAAELIDMRTHHGAHARIGATDVCPFVPVAGVSMDECVAIAREVGARVGRELAIPVYLYEAAASQPARRNLADVRKGEYEGLEAKLGDPAWLPDFGPTEHGERQARSGASVIGARPFLIAYNVNLNTRDKKLANEIAFALRESGRAKKDASGKIVLDAQGEKVMIPGRLKSVKATGWVIEAYGCAQVSMNLTDAQQTPLHAAFEACVEEAEKLGVRVTGSELVGLVPKQALLDAGAHFLRKMKKPDFAPEAELIQTAQLSLGLSQLAPFDAAKKVIEYQIAAPRPLAALSVEKFTDALSSDAPAPGGGSASALAGALAAGLVSMVASITAQKSGALAEIGARAQALKRALVEAIDRDTEAFTEVLAAMRLPKSNAEREQAIEKANQGATQVPLEVMRLAAEAAELAAKAVAEGYAPSLSDAGVAVLLAAAAAGGARLNVLTNVQSLQDRAFADSAKVEATTLIARVRTAEAQARVRLEAAFEK